MLSIQRDKLVCFLYLLIRDTVPPGEIERIMKEVEKASAPMTYSNSFVAGYAESLVKRMAIEVS